MVRPFLGVECWIVCYRFVQIDYDRLTLVDLVHDLLRKRKTSDPIGWQQFANQMHAANIPMELVGNVARRQHIQKRTRIPTPMPKPKKKKKKATRPLQLPDDWESY